MREEIANLVFPILESGLELKERLQRNEPLSFTAEQSKLKAMLKSDLEARAWPDYGGDAPPEGIGGFPRGAVMAARAPLPNQFLGIRYALVCWLDEIFTLDSSWADQWENQALEFELYSTRDRAWRFWEPQAELAATRSDALEAFLLCVVLGFRGNRRDQPDRLLRWVRENQKRIARYQAEKPWQQPPGLTPREHVPFRVGLEEFQRMGRVWGAVLLLVIPLATFALVLRFLS
jgi:type VI secretion system protein ImpK